MSRTIPSDEETIEWLRDTYRAGGPDADLARAALALVDAAQDSENALAEWGDLGVPTPSDMKKIVTTCDALTELIESHDLSKGFDGGEKDVWEHRLQAALDYGQECEEKVFALQTLCADAGILDRNDMTTDPLPLLRMFLPV